MYPADSPTDQLQQDVADVASIKAVPTILDIVCRTTGMRFAAVARVTEDRWVACGVRDDIAFGLEPGGELDVGTTLCHEIRQSGEAVVIDDVAADATYCGHHTPAHYGLKSYISVPIRLPDGTFFGTLCAIDPEPRRLDTPETRAMFEMFAEVIGFQLAERRRADRAEASLFDAQAAATLREQFIAVLGHDLRNPLAAVAAGVRLLRREPQSEAATRILALVDGSVARMTGLIDDVLDFARARLGGGIVLERRPVLLEPVLRQVVDEFAAQMPEREIFARIAVPEPVRCDPSRLGRLEANLLGNALMHGDPAQPVRFEATADAATLRIAVTNAGAPIAPATMARLFQPFVRGEAGANREGLGLGLHIAAEIARAHGGAIAVASTAAETRFTFTMPLAAADG